VSGTEKKRGKPRTGGNKHGLKKILCLKIREIYAVGGLMKGNAGGKGGAGLGSVGGTKRRGKREGKRDEYCEWGESKTVFVSKQRENTDMVRNGKTALHPVSGKKIKRTN